MNLRSTLNGLSRPFVPGQRRPSAGVPRLAGLVLLAALAGCTGVQSALDPAGDDARRLASLTWILFAGGAAIFVPVTALLLYAIHAPPERRRWLATRRAVVIGGLAFPIVTLTMLLSYGMFLMRVINVAGSGSPVRIEVVGEQYWWRVRYPADDGMPAVTTANEIQVPVGRPIEVAVTSTDVIHSFWIPAFAGKIDMIPGRINVLRFQVERAGIYRGQCTEFCGDQHARMAFDVVALASDDFDLWRAAQSLPARQPATLLLELGQRLFSRGGCGNCHAIRGTAAAGQLGPDLTHIGSRRSIGAAQFPNNAGTLAGWIADTQHLKGGSRMPSYGSLAGEELRAIAGYLESLK
jgi:cytochrome c oxidase subunit 2